MFFILPVGVEYDARRYPVVTFVLMGLNVLVYLVGWVVWVSGGEEAFQGFVMTLGLVPAHPSVHGFLTTLFVHAGLFHLLGNLVYLFLFGACVEDQIGRWGFVAFYLLGGLAADLVHVAATVGNDAGGLPLIGASGAVSACIGGFLLLLGRARINFRYFVFLFLRFWSGDFWLPAWLVISFWFLEDAVSAVIDLANESAAGGVAFAAHVGGTLGGLVMIGLYKAVTKGRAEADEPPAPVRPRPVARPAVRVVTPEAPSYLLYENGDQSGPFTATQVRDRLESGALAAEALYWREGMSEWRPVEELRRVE